LQTDTPDGKRFLDDIAKHWGGDGRGWWKRGADGGAVFRTGVDTQIPASAKMPKIRTPYEAAKVRAAEVDATEERIKELQKWRETVMERETKEAAEKALEKKAEADDLLRRCGYQISRSQATLQVNQQLFQSQLHETGPALRLGRPSPLLPLT
jgi:cytochrome c556